MPDTETLTKDTVPEAHQFQAEVAELLRLMVHSVYSETDIFLTLALSPTHPTHAIDCAMRRSPTLNCW